MKKIAVVILFMPFGLLAQKQPATVQSAFTLKNRLDSFSYAVGVNITKSLQQQNFSEVNTAAIASAMNDVFSNTTTKISPQVANDIIQQAFKNAEAKKNAVGGGMADFTQNDTADIPVKLSSFRGKYVLVDFWASWCRPCRMENPNVLASYNKFKNKNFTVLGVSLDKAKDAWIEAIHQDGLYWTQVSDLKGWGNEVAQQFKVQSIPQNFLIDPQGRIIAKDLRGEALDQKLNEILK